MKILILADKFVKSEIVKNYINTYLKKYNIDAIDVIEGSWPLKPFQKNDEIREFEGSESEIATKIQDAEIVILHAAPISQKVISQADKLKLLAVIRGGPVNINLDEAIARKITVLNTPGRNANAVAEYTVGLILSCCKNICRSHFDLMNKNWRYDLYCYEKTGFELKNKIVGLAGFGNISIRITKMLQAFGTSVISFDPYVSEKTMAEYNVKKVSFSEMLKTSDIISVQARLTEETYHLFDSKAFTLMKNNAVFINTARGGLVDYEDLYVALRDKHIAQAALDVFPEEPINFNSPLLELDNIIVTPHIAGATKETLEYGLSLLFEDIVSFLDNKPVKNTLTPSL